MQLKRDLSYVVLGLVEELGISPKALRLRKVSEPLSRRAWRGGRKISARSRLCPKRKRAMGITIHFIFEVHCPKSVVEPASVKRADGIGQHPKHVMLTLRPELGALSPRLGYVKRGNRGNQGQS